MRSNTRLVASVALLLLAAAAAEAKWSPLSILTSGVSAKLDKAGTSDLGDVCSNTSEPGGATGHRTLGGRGRGRGAARG
jgi:hypothetical protein